MKIKIIVIIFNRILIKILIKYPMDIEIKNVWTPNIKRPTKPLSIPTYLAPLIQNELLKITGNGKPDFWDGWPIKLANIATRAPASKQDAKTIKTFKS